MESTIGCAVDGDGIAAVDIDPRGRHGSRIGAQFAAEFDACVDTLAGDEAVRGVLLYTGKSPFCLGEDVGELLGRCARRPAPAEALAEVRLLSGALRKLETCGKPAAAALTGSALGAGLEIALACQYRVVADDASVRVGLPAVELGLLPGAGGTQRLPRLVGMDVALDLLLAGKRLDPAAALAAGLVDERASAAEVFAVARRWLLQRPDPVRAWDRKGYRCADGRPAAEPRLVQAMMFAIARTAAATAHNYPAPLAILAAVYEGVQVPMDAALRIESRYLASLLSDPVTRNMLRAALLLERAGAHDGAARGDGQSAGAAARSEQAFGARVAALAPEWLERCVTRLCNAYTNEGHTLLGEGVAGALIENAARLAGMAIGPLAASDEISLTRICQAAREAAAGSARKMPSGLPVARRLCEEFGRGGRLAGGGFYDYPAAGPRRLWSGLTAIGAPRASQPHVDTVVQRLLVVQALEAARCLEQGVDAAAIDLEALADWGFPAWTGGPLSYIDMLGHDAFVAICDRLALECGERFAVSAWLRAQHEPFHTDCSA